jgi:hypothetical protein
MWYLVPLLGLGGIALTVILLRVVHMFLDHEIDGGEFALITGLLGCVGFYSWGLWPTLPSLLLLGSVPLACAGLAISRRQLRMRTAKGPLRKAVGLIVWLEAALKKAPNNADVKVALGDAYASLGRMDEALNQYQGAALLLPRSPEVSRKRRETVRRQSRMFREGVMFCALCGSANPKRRRFCHRCGTMLPESSVSPHA